MFYRQYVLRNTFSNSIYHFHTSHGSHIEYKKHEEKNSQQIKTPQDNSYSQNFISFSSNLEKTQSKIIRLGPF